MSQGVIGSLKQGSAATDIRSLLDPDSPARGLKGIGLLSHQSCRAGLSRGAVATCVRRAGGQADPAAAQPRAGFVVSAERESIGVS